MIHEAIAINVCAWKIRKLISIDDEVKGNGVGMCSTMSVDQTLSLGSKMSHSFRSRKVNQRKTVNIEEQPTLNDIVIMRR